MKQRIKLAQALVHGPKLLFLDEPTNGLDPAGRDHMLELIRDISHGKGINVLLSSHLLPDIERTCDTVVVMRAGKIAAQDEVASLRRTAGVQVDVELRYPQEADPFLQAIARYGARVVTQSGTRCRLALEQDSDQAVRTVFLAARESGGQVRGVQPALRSLEEVFLEVVE